MATCSCPACCRVTMLPRCSARSARSRAMRDGCGATGRWSDAIAEPSGFCVDPDPTYLKTLRRINRLEDYHALKHHPVLIDLLERMLGGPILPHPRVLMRNIFPAREEYHHQGASGFPQRAGHHRGLHRVDAADRLPDGRSVRCRSRPVRTPPASTTSASPAARAASRSRIRSKDVGSPATSRSATCCCSTA